MRVPPSHAVALSGSEGGRDVVLDVVCRLPLFVTFERYLAASLLRQSMCNVHA